MHHFPSKRCMVSRNVLLGAEYWDTAPFLDFKVFLGCCQGFAFRKCHDEGLRKCLFFFLWKINHLWWSFHFLCLFRWRIMELFDGNVESPKKGPVENLTWNSHFIPFLVPKKVPEQNRLSFDETGSGSSELFFCYKKMPVEEQLHPSKGLFQSKGCNSCIMHLPLILKHKGHSMFGMIRIWNSSTSLELSPFFKCLETEGTQNCENCETDIQIYDIWCNNVIYDIIYMYTLSTF